MSAAARPPQAVRPRLCTRGISNASKCLYMRGMPSTVMKPRRLFAQTSPKDWLGVTVLGVPLPLPFSSSSPSTKAEPQSL